MLAKIMFGNMSNDCNTLYRLYLDVTINPFVLGWQHRKINEAAVRLL